MDIVHETIIRTSPDKVYDALTEQAGIAAWYAEDTQAQPLISSIAEFHFDRGSIRVEIARLETHHKVSWKVLQGLPGWEGVTGDITWILTTPFGSGTTLIHLTHSGWPAMDGPYPSVNYKWAWFISRMKDYLETSNGASSSFEQLPD